MDRHSPNFCPTLQFLVHAMCWLLRAPDKRFSHTLGSLGQWPRLTCSFRSPQGATLLECRVPPMNCFVCKCFCVVHGLKPLLHHHNWLSFDKYQDTERLFIPCPCHVSSWIPPISVTCKYATASSTQKNLRRYSLPIDMLLSAASVLVLLGGVWKFRRDLWITLCVYMCGKVLLAFGHVHLEVGKTRKFPQYLPRCMWNFKGSCWHNHILRYCICRCYFIPVNFLYKHTLCSCDWFCEHMYVYVCTKWH
jgi:hypothetical protein